MADTRWKCGYFSHAADAQGFRGEPRDDAQAGIPVSAHRRSTSTADVRAATATAAPAPSATALPPDRGRSKAEDAYRA